MSCLGPTSSSPPYQWIFALFALTVVASAPLHASDADSVQRALDQGDQVIEESPLKATIYYENAVRLARALGNPILIADSSAKLGQAAFLIGDHYSALKYRRLAFELYQKHDVKDQAAAQLSAIGSTYYFSKVGDLEQAKAYYDEAIQWYQAHNMESEVALNRNYSAYIAWAEGRKEDALRMHQDALKQFEAIGDRHGMATALSDIGFTLNSLSQYERALEYSFRALEMERALSNVLMQIPTLNNIGISYYGMGNYSEALDYCTTSLKMADARNLLLRKNEAVAVLHQIYRDAGDYEQAYAMAVKYKNLNDQIVISNQARSILETDMTQRFREREQTLRFEAEKAQALSAEILRREQLRNMSLIVILSLTLLLVAMLFWYIRHKRRTHQILSKQKTELHEKNQILEASMQDLQMMQRELIRMEKNAALGALTQGAAHEINNPMNYIQGAIYGIQDELADEKEAVDRSAIRSMIDEIQEGVNRTVQIIDGLYTFRRQNQSTSPQQINIADFLEAFHRHLPVEQRNRISLNLVPQNAKSLVLADETALDQMLSHLIQNAIEASAPHDQIGVDLDTSKRKHTTLRIRDRGCGIEPDNLARIFDPFYTSKQQTHAVGLGLTFVQRIVSEMNARIEFDSTPDQGTVVTIQIPHTLAEHD